MPELIPFYLPLRSFQVEPSSLEVLAERYCGRVSGPLLDRIDLHVEVPAVGLTFAMRRRNFELAT